MAALYLCNEKKPEADFPIKNVFSVLSSCFQKVDILIQIIWQWSDSSLAEKSFYDFLQTQLTATGILKLRVQLILLTCMKQFICDEKARKEMSWELLPQKADVRNELHPFHFNHNKFEKHQDDLLQYFKVVPQKYGTLNWCYQQCYAGTEIVVSTETVALLIRRGSRRLKCFPISVLYFHLYTFTLNRKRAARVLSLMTKRTYRKFKKFNITNNTGHMTLHRTSPKGSFLTSQFWRQTLLNLIISRSDRLMWKLKKGLSKVRTLKMW